MGEGVGGSNGLPGQRIDRLARLVHVDRIAPRILVLPRGNRVHDPNTDDPRIQLRSPPRDRELKTLAALDRGTYSPPRHTRQPNVTDLNNLRRTDPCASWGNK